MPEIEVLCLVVSCHHLLLYLFCGLLLLQEGRGAERNCDCIFRSSVCSGRLSAFIAVPVLWFVVVRGRGGGYYDCIFVYNNIIINAFMFLPFLFLFTFCCCCFQLNFKSAMYLYVRLKKKLMHNVHSIYFLDKEHTLPFKN